MQSRTVLALAAAATLLSALAVSAAGPKGDPNDVANYKHWNLVTPVPLDLDPILAVQCMPPQALRHGLNGHDAKFYNVYVNDIGKKAMMDGGPFPVGSRIVKEKLIPTGQDPHDWRQTKVQLLTVMVKHNPSFDGANHDWEFFTTDENGKRIDPPKEISDCANCHHDRMSRDMVFRTYLPRRAGG